MSLSLWAHNNQCAVAVVEELLGECLNIIGGYAFEDAEVLIFVIIPLIVIANDC